MKKSISIIYTTLSNVDLLEKEGGKQTGRGRIKTQQSVHGLKIRSVCLFPLIFWGVFLYDRSVSQFKNLKKSYLGNSLAVQSLGLQAFPARAGSIPGRGAKIPQAEGTPEKKKLIQCMLLSEEYSYIHSKYLYFDPFIYFKMTFKPD